MKINSDKFPELTRRYGVRGIPPVKAFVDGEVLDEFVGAMPEHALRRWLDRVLASARRDA